MFHHTWVRGALCVVLLLCMQRSSASRVLSSDAREPENAAGEFSWDQAVEKLRDGLTSTEDALDLVGMSTGVHQGVHHIGALLAFLEGKKALLGDSNSQPVSDAWQADISEHQEAYNRALEELQQLEAHLGDSILQDADCPNCEALEQQLLTTPLEALSAKIEAFTDAAATLQKLRSKCTGHHADASEGVYARLWRLGETCLRPSRNMPAQALKALRQSAYEALIEVQAKAAEQTMVQTLCPAAASAARSLLLANTRDDPSANHRVFFLLSVLNNPAAPEGCNQIYRDLDPDVSTTCTCEPGECSKKSAQEDLVKWSCQSCSSGQCGLFWQREQCEQNDGCDENTTAAATVLGSRAATQALLRRELYFDPSCKGIVDCLKRQVGEETWQRFSGYGKTLLSLRRDWLAAAALASVGTKLLALSLGSGSSSVLETDTGSAENLEISGEQVRGLVEIIKPALLSYLWIRVRINSVKDRASTRGFCRRAAKELSEMAQAQHATPKAEDTPSNHDHAEELSEVIAGGLPQSSGDKNEKEQQAEQLQPLLTDAIAKATLPLGAFHPFFGIGTFGVLGSTIYRPYGLHRPLGAGLWRHHYPGMLPMHGLPIAKPIDQEAANSTGWTNHDALEELD